MEEENKQFANTFQNPPKRFYQGPLIVNGIVKGVLFCNIANIEEITPELQNVRIAECDGTLKVVPKFLENDAYQLFTFHVIYKDVIFPLVHEILTGTTEEIYVALLLYIRNVLPLLYNNVTLITDYKFGLINAIRIVFPESQHQGCYFYFCQAVICLYVMQETKWLECSI